MGKSKKNFRRRRGGRPKRDRDSNSNGGGSFVPVEKGNFKMECYYALQGLHNQRFNDDGQLVECTTDAERQAERLRWRSTLGEILPASFRIGKDVPAYYQVKLEQELQTLLREATEYHHEEDGANADTNANDNDDDNNKPDDPRRAPLVDIHLKILRFLPHAYQLGLDRSTIRKNPALQKLHAWLKHEVASGHVTRQETVSMVPPVLLNVQSSDVVLDMCAAPGSKTSQLLEDLSCNNDNDNNSASSSSQQQPKNGVLVANDASSPRAQMLASQLRRILGHHPVALITAVPAQFFPSQFTQFDKILCDVPCSGDGTTRKNINVWKAWGATGALALHALQLQIAFKGVAQLLRVGGTMCYSTCSFNPTENEAVVAELLRRSHGALELVDCCGGERLEGFGTRPGMSTWKVLCEGQSLREWKNGQKKHNAKMQARRQEFAAQQQKAGEDDGAAGVAAATNESGGEVVGNDDAAAAAAKDDDDNEADGQPVLRKFDPTSLDEASLLEMAASANLQYFASVEEVPPKLQKRIPKSAFPPTPEEAADFHLERCIRCLPQDNNTGGFFVALLRKTAPMSATDRRAAAARENDGTTAVTEPPEKKAKVDSNEDAPPAAAAAAAAAEDEDVDAAEEEGLDDADAEIVEGLDPDNKPILHAPIKGNLVEGGNVGKDDFMPVADEILDPLIDFYGLANGFEKELYMSRACGEAKIIYFIARPVFNLFELGLQKRVTIIGSGLKAFQRNRRNDNDSGVNYRVCQEAIAFIHPYMTKRRFVVSLEDFKTCLGGDNKTIHLSKFSDAFREKIKDLPSGSFVAVMEGYEERPSDKLVATMWKCRGESIDSLVAKIEIEEMLSKLAVIEKQE